MNFQPLVYKFIASPQQASTAYTLLLLHGTGGDETDLIPLSGYFGDKINVLSVRGNVSENGMPRFFRRLAMGVFDEKDVRFRAEELVDFLTKKGQELGIDTTKIIALGYSNGANIAGAILMLFPQFLAGAALIRPMQPLQAVHQFQTTLAQPVLITSGTQDFMTSPEDTLAYVQLLKANGFSVSHQALNTGHTMTQQDISLAAQWFRENFTAVKTSQHT